VILLLEQFLKFRAGAFRNNKHDLLSSRSPHNLIPDNKSIP
jgi:hypothetical protein